MPYRGRLMGYRGRVELRDRQHPDTIGTEGGWGTGCQCTWGLWGTLAAVAVDHTHWAWKHEGDLLSFALALIDPFPLRCNGGKSRH